MSFIAIAMKNLKYALKKEEIPTVSEIVEITRLVAELTAKVVKDEEESSSGEDVSSVECDTDEESEEDSTEDSEEDSTEDSKAKKKEKEKDSKEKDSKAKRQPSARALGYRLYMNNGGTRASWAKKSEKYKNTYYELRHLYENKHLKK